MPAIKLIFKTCLLLIVVTILGTIGINSMVKKSSENSIYGSASEMPRNKVGLLLGTGKYVAGGRINLYYKFRIDAAVDLFNNKKVDFILVSGDNSRKSYDEPSTIKNDLMERGIPAERIFLDYAGFRTLDSVVRCKEIFGQKSITIISQQFHNERAIFIARQNNIEAIGFNAKDVNVQYGFKTRIREYLARVKMVLDLIFGKKPKFLGDKIEIK